MHAAAGLHAKRINGLTTGKKVTLISEQRRGNFFNVKLEDNSTGWVHGKYLLLPDIPETEFTGPGIVMAAGQPSFPLCGPARHYRWQQKISTSGFNQQPTSRSVNAVLAWAALSFSGHDLLSWCQPRTTKETKAYSVPGFVRRTRTETDGDVHIEITQNATDAVGDCLVVEIPPADLSSRFNKARNDLATLLSVPELGKKDFDTPTRARFTGLAFWDGWHATSSLPVNHGRCNSTKGAAWELHGVFKVAAP